MNTAFSHPGNWLSRPAAWWCVFLVIYLAAAFSVRSGEIVETNAPRQWLPLTEVLKKWDASPPDEVRGAAGGGNLMAEYYLGYCCTQGRRFELDAKAGIDWYQRAGKGGYLPAYHRLAEFYWNPSEIPQDRDKALEYFRLAAEAGYAPSQFTLGDQLQAPALKRDEKGNTYAPRSNLAGAIKWYRRAAEQNFAPAQYALGRCYLEGLGMPGNEELGLEWNRKAADQGNPDALLDLARGYAGGLGEPRNEADRPAALLIRIIEKGAEVRPAVLNAAYEQLEFRYKFGFSGGVDLVAAAKLYCQAARSGVANYVLANKVLATPAAGATYMPFDGLHSSHVWIPFQPDGGRREKEFLSVLSAYLKSARRDPAALMQIGSLYLAGQFVPKSPQRAWEWFKLAADNGAAAAAQKIATTEAMMTPEEQPDARSGRVKLLEELDQAAEALNRKE